MAKGVNMQQVKIPSWVGAIQVQLTNSFFYIALLNTAMLSVTLWATTGPSIQAVWPWARFWMLILIGVIVVCGVMILDYRFMYPVRQAFINIQACKHTNPAMEILVNINGRIDRIEKHLGIEKDE